MTVSGTDPAEGDEKAPDVSVIVAAYNAEATLEAAVRSALSQEGVALEIIIVDDASTDGTRRVVRRLAGEDSRVVPISVLENGGVSRARNAALEAASGTWVTPLDADDTYVPGRLLALVAEAERHEADLVADNVIKCGEDGTRQGVFFTDGFGERARITTQAFVASSARGNVSLGYTKPLIRRAFLEKNGLRYPEHIQCAEDWYLYLACLLRGARFYALPEAYYNYTVHPQSFSRQRARMVTNLVQLLAMYKEARLMALQCGDNITAHAIEERLPFLRRYLFKQRLKKTLLDIPVVADYIDRRKGRNPAY